MGKNRKSIGGWNNVPTETPEEFQTRYNTTQQNLEEWVNDKGKSKLSKPQIKRLLDAVLDENTKYVGTQGNKIIFSETIRNSNGTISETEIRIDLNTYKQMYKKGAVVSIEDLMGYYHSIPSFRRGLVDSVNFGGTGSRFHGGFFRPSTNGIYINTKALVTKSWLKSGSLESTLEHEFTHGTDYNLSSRYATIDGNKFQKIMEHNQASAYSEKFNNIFEMDRYYKESLAEAVMVTRMARKYGGDNAYIEDPNKTRGHDITYNDWADKNKELADFANKFIDCKNENELKELFGI